MLWQGEDPSGGQGLLITLLIIVIALLLLTFTLITLLLLVNLINILLLALPTWINQSKSDSSCSGRSESDPSA